MEDTYLKSDIVSVKCGKASMIDVRVLSDSRSLDPAHYDKVRKCNKAELITAIKNMFMSNVFVTSSTPNWRGVFSSKSADYLLLILSYENGVG